MTENHKDILQKFIQKYGLINPEYVTMKSGPDHSPNFISTVTINNKSFIGQLSNTKKGSEKLAAFEALKNIKTFTQLPKMCLLIDICNLPNIEDQITIKELSNRNLDIYMFMSDDSINKKFPSEIIKILLPKEKSDDICISTYTGFLLANNLYDIYFIASSDTFSSKLVKIINNENLGWCSKKAYQINKISQIYEYY